MTKKVLDYETDWEDLKERFMQDVPEERRDGDLAVMMRLLVYM